MKLNDSEYREDVEQFELITPREASKILRIPADRLNRWRHKGIFFCKYYKIGGDVFYSKLDIREYLIKNARNTEVLDENAKDI